MTSDAATETVETAETPAVRPTPIVVRRRTRNILWATAAILTLLVLWMVPSVITVMIGGGAMALVLSYPVRLLTRVMPRNVAVLITLLSVLAAAILTLLVLVPPVITQLGEFVDDLPGIADEADARLRDFIQDLETDGVLPSDSDDVVRDIQQGLLDRASVGAETLLTGVLGTLTSALGLVVQFFGILFVAIYLLLDAEKLKFRCAQLATARYREDILELWDDLGRSLSRYLGGLIVISGAQGVVAAVGLLVLGVPYALLLGVWTAMTAVIPYLGSWLGAAPALALAFLESPRTGVFALVLYFGMNTIEGNSLTPRIQGQAVQVHPVLVLLAVLAAGGIFGLAGVLLAIPALAMGRVVFDFLRVRVQVRDDLAVEPIPVALVPPPEDRALSEG